MSGLKTFAVIMLGLGLSTVSIAETQTAETQLEENSQKFMQLLNCGLTLNEMTLSFAVAKFHGDSQSLVWVEENDLGTFFVASPSSQSVFQVKVPYESERLIRARQTTNLITMPFNFTLTTPPQAEVNLIYTLGAPKETGGKFFHITVDAISDEFIEGLPNVVAEHLPVDDGERLLTEKLQRTFRDFINNDSMLESRLPNFTPTHSGPTLMSRREKEPQVRAYAQMLTKNCPSILQEDHDLFSEKIEKVFSYSQKRTGGSPRG